MASKICLPLPNQTPYYYYHYHRPSPKFPSNSIPKSLKHHSHQNNKIPNKDTLLLSPLSLTKRSLNLSALTLIFYGIFPHNSKALSDKDLVLERYTDFEHGFTLLRPSSWTKIKKIVSIFPSNLCCFSIFFLFELIVLINEFGVWGKVEKAGATLLLEEPKVGSNNVGVVVNPVP